MLEGFCSDNIRPQHTIVVKQQQNKETILQDQDALPPHRSRKVIRLPTHYSEIGEANVVISNDSKIDPLTFTDAMEDSDKQQWLKPMDLEMDTMYSNSIWDLVDKPNGSTREREERRGKYRPLKLG